MSTLLDEASLVLIPSGYKEDVVYSQIPTDGAGDLSFTRASNGTRINSAGLVEVVPWNLLQYSEQFNNAYWTENGASVSANAIVSPNGTTTADKIIENSANSVHHILYPNDTPIGTNTLSVYAKEGERNWIWLYIFDNVTGSLFTWFNVNTGTIGTVDSGLTANIESVGNGWFRCSITRTQGNIGNGGFGVTNANSVLSYTGNGTSGAYFWGAQLNIGSTAKPYFPTTDRLNVPRLTYQNGGGGCPSLLLEKQSTNIALYSEDFSNSAWIKDSAVITSNTNISPDGTQNADTLTISPVQYLRQNLFLPTSTTYTLSVYVKVASGTKQFVMGTYSGTGNDFGSSTMTATTTWQRFSFTFTTVVSDFTNIYPLTVDGLSGGDFYLWGAQCEASSYVTSYIPTTSASATRVADSCFKTGISSLIGQSEGTVFLDFIPQGGNITQEVFGVTVAGGGAEYIAMYAETNGNLYFITNIITSKLISSNAFGQRFKVAYSYKAGTHLIYANGVQISATTFSSVYSLLDALYINQSATGTGVEKLTTNEMLFSKTAFTNDQLETLTGTFYVSYEEMAQALNYYYD
jgi:hypothetical protein